MRTQYIKVINTYIIYILGASTFRSSVSSWHSSQFNEKIIPYEHKYFENC